MTDGSDRRLLRHKIMVSPVVARVDYVVRKRLTCPATPVGSSSQGT
jgi:hypothetical protein